MPGKKSGLNSIFGGKNSFFPEVYRKPLIKLKGIFLTAIGSRSNGWPL